MFKLLEKAVVTTEFIKKIRNCNDCLSVIGKQWLFFNIVARAGHNNCTARIDAGVCPAVTVWWSQPDNLAPGHNIVDGVNTWYLA